MKKYILIIIVPLLVLGITTSISAQKTDRVVKPNKTKKRKDKNNFKLHGAGYEPKHKQKLKKDAIKFKADRMKDNSGDVNYTDIKKRREDSDRKTSSYSGKTPQGQVKNRKRRYRDKARAMADDSGNIPYVDMNRLRAKKNAKTSSYSGNIRYTNLAKAKEKKNKLTSSYAGTIPLRSVKVARKRNIRDKARAMADYSGNIRYVNMQAKRAKTSRKLSSALGPVKIRIRKKPKFAYSSFSKKRANRAKKLNYDHKRFKSGRKVKKSDLPNYQKGKPNKIDYNSREAKWNLNRVKNAKTGELPKGNKKKNKKSKKAKQQAPPENQGE